MSKPQRALSRFVWLVRIGPLCGLIALQVSLSCAAPPQANEANKAISAVRQALHLPQPSPQGYVLTGKASFSGTEGEARLEFDEEGRFLQQTVGPLSAATAFDGKTCWKQDWNQTPQITDLREREVELLQGAFLTGSLFQAGAPFVFTVDAENSTEKQTALIATANDGEVSGRVLLDKATSLPQTLQMIGPRGSRLDVSNFHDVAGRKIPGKVVITQSSGMASTFELTNVAAVASLERQHVDFVDGFPANYSFDSSAPAELTLKQAPTGHLLVQVQLNDAPASWFILDTGAGSLVVNTSYAKELNLQGFGVVNVQGVGGASQSQFRKAERLVVGPLTMTEPILVETDLDFLKQYMGEPIAGILGFEMFARCVAEVDFVTPSAKLYDAKTYDLKNAQWQELFFTSRHPAIRAEFEQDGAGVFQLDTGAAGSTLVFHTPAVKQLNLLDGRETTTTSSGGVGGAVQVETGKLSSFRFAGQEFKDQTVGFATDSRGAFADEDTLGVIGGVFIRPFTMVLDYPHKRIAFVKRPE